MVPNGFWSTNIFGSKKNQAIKFLGQKILSPKIFQVKNYLGLTKIESEKFRVWKIRQKSLRSKKMLVHNIWVNKILGLHKFWVQKNFIQGLQKNWVKKLGQLSYSWYGQMSQFIKVPLHFYPGCWVGGRFVDFSKVMPTAATIKCEDCSLFKYLLSRDNKSANRQTFPANSSQALVFNNC